jgi:membrane-associated protease RseP (regulator of RpoE activity)
LTRKPKPRHPAFYLGMLGATFLTTFLSGLALADPEQETWRWVADGMTFPAALLSILLAHELGHFLACRAHRLDATLPLFIPGPPFPYAIGTFGAFIRILTPIRQRAKLLDVGAAGPLAGFVLALVWTVIGLALSRIEPLPEDMVGLSFGESALFAALRIAIAGVPPEGHDVFLHPMAMAGWLGLFVTSLNLLAAGQLDGGHIVHALFGRAHGVVSRVVFVALAWWGVLGDPQWGVWWHWPVMAGLLAWPIVLSLRPARRKLDRNVFIALILLYVVMETIAGANSASSVWLVWGLLVYLFGLDHPTADVAPALGAGRSVGCA